MMEWYMLLEMKDGSVAHGVIESSENSIIKQLDDIIKAENPLTLFKTIQGTCSNVSPDNIENAHIFKSESEYRNFLKNKSF